MVFSESEKTRIKLKVKSIVEDALFDSDFTYDEVLEEVCKAKGSLSLFEIDSYLRGLPSACSLPYYNDFVINMVNNVTKKEIDTLWKNEWAVVNMYWRMAAEVLYKKGDVC